MLKSWYFQIVVLEVSWQSLGQQRSNQLTLKEINPEYSLKELMVKMNLQYSGHLMWKANSLKKKPWCWERLKTRGEEDDRGWDVWMASLTQWIWVWASSGSWWRTRKLACCNPWSGKGLDMTEQLNWTYLSLFTCYSLCLSLGITCVFSHLLKLFIFSQRPSWPSYLKSYPLCHLYIHFLFPYSPVSSVSSSDNKIHSLFIFIWNASFIMFGILDCSVHNFRRKTFRAMPST